jgi:hypothetical protein
MNTFVYSVVFSVGHAEVFSIRVRLGVPSVLVSVVPPGVLTTISPWPGAAAPTVARI